MLGRAVRVGACCGSRVQQGAVCLTLPSDPWAMWGGVYFTGGAGVGA